MTTEQPISAASAPAEAEKRKRPASQYYWGDWRRDTALQACSISARGLWHEMNCLMHDCEPYGHLVVGGAPMLLPQLARLAGITPKECTALLAELEAAGVFSRTQAGVIFSRRMVRDEELRERRAAGGAAGAEHGAKGAQHGAKGGRPRKQPAETKPQEGGVKTPLGDNFKPPPASASATADRTTEHAQPACARAAGDDPPEANGLPPTPAGLVCRAMREVGVERTNPGDARLQALLAQGATVGEFIGLAAEAVAKRVHDPFAWTMAVLPARRADAAGLQLQGAPVQPRPVPSVTVPSDDADRTQAMLAARDMTEDERQAAQASAARAVERMALLRAELGQGAMA